MVGGGTAAFLSIGLGLTSASHLAGVHCFAPFYST